MAALSEIKSKLTHQEIKELSERSIFPWIVDVAFDWIVIGLSFYFVMIFPNPFTIIASIILLGNRQHALTVLGHDAAHLTLSKSKAINDFISDFFAFWSLGLTTEGYRNLHYRHHGHANTSQDPELAHRGSRAPQWDLPMSRFKIFKYALYDLVGYSIKDFLIIVIFSKPGHMKSVFFIIAYHMIAIATLSWLGLWWIPLLWYISLITSFMMFFRLRTFLEHLGTDDTHRVHLTWLQQKILAPHNIGYHWEHHNYPTIPYNKLPLVRTLLNEVPIISLSDIFDFYENSEKIPSGAILKQSS